MYKTFYLMEKEPFDIHPSPDLFYKSDAHQNGWGYLFQGIKSEEPILLVTGEYGTGKTLLCLRLVQLFKTLQKKTGLPSVYLSTPTYDFKRVLEKMAVALDIFSEDIGKYKESVLQQSIYDYFENVDRKKKEKCVYLIIDDAQDFNYSFINKLRLLCSYNISGVFPIRLILFAHQDFFEILNDRKNAALAGRIKRIYRLNPFDFEDTREYIYFRLTYSGASGAPVFDDEAIKLIQTASRGIPRLINNICDNCLLVAGNERVNDIDTALVKQAMKMGNMVGLGYGKINDGEKDDEYGESSADTAYPRAGGSVSNDGEVHRNVSESMNSPHPLPDYSASSMDPPRPADSRPDSAAASSPGNAPGNYPDGPAGYTPERHSGDAGHSEAVSPAPLSEEKETSSEKKGKFKGADLAKIGVIIVLVIIIVGLLFYIFNQSTTGHDGDALSDAAKGHVGPCAMYHLVADTGGRALLDLELSQGEHRC